MQVGIVHDHQPWIDRLVIIRGILQGVEKGLTFFPEVAYRRNSVLTLISPEAELRICRAQITVHRTRLRIQSLSAFEMLERRIVPLMRLLIRGGSIQTHLMGAGL